MKPSSKYIAVIVEDEPHQHARLQDLIHENHPELEIAGIAENVEESFAMIQYVRPQLIFLDVMLGAATGFDLLKKFTSLPFKIIFTTSFEEFAVKAFRLSAVDYLIKPVVPEELAQAVEKFKAQIKNENSGNHLEVLLRNIQTVLPRKKKVALPTLTGYIFIAIEEIIRCESDNTYTTFYLGDKRKIVVSKTLKECEIMLSEYSFFRVHNSHMINLEYIAEYIKGEGGVVKMTDGSHVDVSRRRKEEFLRQFNRIGSMKE